MRVFFPHRSLMSAIIIDTTFLLGNIFYIILIVIVLSNNVYTYIIYRILHKLLIYLSGRDWELFFSNGIKSGKIILIFTFYFYSDFNIRKYYYILFDFNVSPNVVYCMSPLVEENSVFNVLEHNLHVSLVGVIRL